jgi:hypothetical protein
MERRLQMFDTLFWLDPSVAPLLADQHLVEARAIFNRSADAKRPNRKDGRDAGPTPPSNRVWTDAASLPPVSAA